MEHSNDLVRLCALMHIKNELQTVRHTVRKQEARFQQALAWKRWRVEHRKKRVAANQHVPFVPEPCDRYISKKLKRNSVWELRILFRTAHIANETAKLNISLFTHKHRKEMNAICKRNGWYLCTQSASATYVGIRKLNKETQRYEWAIQGREQLGYIGAVSILESAMVKT